MNSVLSGIQASVLAAVVLLTGAASGKDAGVEGGTVSDAGKSCTSSDDCTQPAVHCHPTRHECVQCLSNRNCGGGLVCDVAAGMCTTCSSDADCAGDAPYCASGACVQCRTDANCGTEGVVCSGGLCGTCGDGVCHRSEKLVDNSGFGREDLGCPEDCASQCPTLTLGLNEARTVSVTRNLFETNCAQIRGMNDFTLAFTAPKEFVYRLNLRTDDLDAFVSISELSDCATANRGCAVGDLQRYGYGFVAEAGQTVTFLVESATVRRFELEIVEEGPLCKEANCDPTEPKDAGGPTEARTAECLASASKRGDPICAGVTCACTECPRAYDDCGDAKGCTDVVQCMDDKGCKGVDCYTTGACRRLIDSHGGVSGAAFGAATALQACTLSHLCALPCAAPDAGNSVPDAGALCAPGRKVACSCGDGNNGSKVCDDSGMSFAECVCSPRSDVPEASSCDCRLGRRASSGGVALLLFGLAAGLAACRTRRVRVGHEWRRRR